MGRPLRALHVDGDQIWISVTVIRTEEDGDVYFDGIIQDITERKGHERKHRAVIEELSADEDVEDRLS